MKIIINSVMIVLISAVLFCSCADSDNQTSENTEQTQESEVLTKVSETISETTEQDKTEIITTTVKMQTTQSPKNYCIAEGCYKEATKSIVGISGQTEYYCKEHYDELEYLIIAVHKNIRTKFVGAGFPVPRSRRKANNLYHGRGTPAPTV